MNTQSYQFLKLPRPEVYLGFLDKLRPIKTRLMYVPIPALSTVKSKFTDKLRFSGYFAKYYL